MQARLNRPPKPSSIRQTAGKIGAMSAEDDAADALGIELQSETAARHGVIAVYAEYISHIQPRTLTDGLTVTVLLYGALDGIAARLDARPTPPEWARLMRMARNLVRCMERHSGRKAADIGLACYAPPPERDAASINRGN